MFHSQGFKFIIFYICFVVNLNGCQSSLKCQNLAN